jgi:hypothetical protein
MPKKAAFRIPAGGGFALWGRGCFLSDTLVHKNKLVLHFLIKAL